MLLISEDRLPQKKSYEYINTVNNLDFYRDKNENIFEIKDNKLNITIINWVLNYEILEKTNKYTLVKVYWYHDDITIYKLPINFKKKEEKNWEIIISYIWYSKEWKLDCDTIYNPEDDKIYLSSSLTYTDLLDYNDKKIIRKYFYWLERVIYNTLDKLSQLF